MATLFTSLPRHLYCQVSRSFTHKDPKGFTPAVWFGLTSMPGRAWGLTVLLEGGAIYSHLPPHALLFSPPFEEGAEIAPWSIAEAQLWDCFGTEFTVHEYEHLSGRTVECFCGPLSERYFGEYLFTAQHYGDGWSRAPEQAKQYHFVQLDNGRLCTLPANRILVHAPEFGQTFGIPQGLKRQTEIYTCEP